MATGASGLWTYEGDDDCNSFHIITKCDAVL